MRIHWYPGHMAKSKRLIKEDISLVDIIIELLDARVPESSRNPDIDELAQNKGRIIILNKSDLASEEGNRKWKEYFEDKGYEVILTNSVTGQGLNQITNISRELTKEKRERQKARGLQHVAIRAMVVGIPNVGKSTLINRYVGRKTAKTGDKPGVTRKKQWIRIKKDLELLDTPGLLWPKFEDPQTGLMLAFTGAVKDEVMDTYTLSLKLIDTLKEVAPNSLINRYNIESEEEEADIILENIAIKRGFIMRGGIYDIERASNVLLDEFRSGKLGRITLEYPKDK